MRQVLLTALTGLILSCSPKFGAPNLNKPVKAGDYTIDIPAKGKVYEGGFQYTAFTVPEVTYEEPNLVIGVGCEMELTGTTIEDLKCLGQNFSGLTFSVFQHHNEEITKGLLESKLAQAKPAGDLSQAGMVVVAGAAALAANANKSQIQVKYNFEVPQVLPADYILAMKIDLKKLGTGYVYSILRLRQRIDPSVPITPPPPPEPNKIARLRRFNSIGQMAVVGNTVFFAAADGSSGRELWKTDGTTNGTTMVKDIYPGVSGSYPNSSNPYSFTSLNGTLFFQANDGHNGYELWKSDGTANGTTLVKDIYPGVSGSYPNYFTPLNGTLFFAANDGTNGYELWKSDGTTLVKDIFTGSGSSYPYSLTPLNGTLFFEANDGTNGIELWKSDGTTNGTTLVKDIFTGSSSSNPYSLTPLNGTLFFRAHNSTNGYELWKSDGTANGTTMVEDFYPGSSASYPHDLTPIGTSLVFYAYDSTDLWLCRYDNPNTGP